MPVITHHVFYGSRYCFGAWGHPHGLHEVDIIFEVFLIYIELLFKDHFHLALFSGLANGFHFFKIQYSGLGSPIRIVNGVYMPARIHIGPDVQDIFIDPFFLGSVTESDRIEDLTESNGEYTQA